jgi:hypothetical protein
MAEDALFERVVTRSVATGRQASDCTAPGPVRFCLVPGLHERRSERLAPHDLRTCRRPEPDSSNWSGTWSLSGCRRRNQKNAVGVVSRNIRINHEWGNCFENSQGSGWIALRMRDAGRGKNLGTDAAK